MLVLHGGDNVLDLFNFFTYFGRLLRSLKEISPAIMFFLGQILK
jgi:hypothetical protein